MSTESALLAAISANPDEDTPRLVYADLSHNKISRAVKTAIEKRFAQPSE